MPHITFVPFTGLRVREEGLREYGMTLPGLAERGRAVSELPALGLLTLAGMLPEKWTSSYRSHTGNSEGLLEQILQEQPSLVAISALTASIEDAYRLSSQIRTFGIPVVIGGLHATACPNEASQFCDSVVVGEGEAVWLQVLSDCEANALQPTYSSFESSTITTWPAPRLNLLQHQKKQRHLPGKWRCLM
ncbi:MAG: cobalamin-dependent protein [Pirellulaceae bacterium]